MSLSASLSRWRPLRSATAVLALSGALSLGLMLLAAYAVLLARGDVTSGAETEALNIARAAGQDITRNLELYDLELRTVARLMETPGVLALPAQLRQAMLFGGAARDEHFGFINVLDAHGDVVADSASAVPLGRNWAGRDYFTAQRRSSKDGLFIGAPFDKVRGGFTLIPVSRRLSQPDGSFAGVVVGSVRLDYFAELFGRFAIGAHGTMTLLDDNGTILQRMPAAPNEIGHIVANETRPSADAALLLTVADPVDGKVRRTLLYHLQDLPLTVAVGLAPGDIYAAWDRRAAAILSAVAALGLLNLLLLSRLRRAAAVEEADKAKMRDQALELQSLAAQHVATMAAQKEAHARRVRWLDEVTHDLRTALHSVLVNADLVRQTGALNPQQANHLASACGAGEHLRDLADRFLRDARDGDAAALKLEPTDLRTLIADCRHTVGLAAEQKDLRLLLEADDALPGYVVTDGGRLRVILSNLLDNAIKYTDFGHVALNVSLEGCQLRCVISDTGRGMPEVQKRRLLQDDDSTGELPGRSGMGLSIVRRHTATLGGQLRCLHNPGGGSIVCVDLPATPAAPSGLPLSSGTAAPMVAPALRVLVVDDSALSREPTASLLRAAGHAVTEARSGEAAVRQVCDVAFDAVVLDMRMPGMSGPETARRIRTLPGARGRIPIIALSATPPAQGLAAWQQAGITEYVEKSGDIATLLRAIGRAATDGTEASPRRPPDPAPTVADEAQLCALAEEVLKMRILLGGSRPDPDPSQLDELIHQVAGDSDQFGFAALAAACRRYGQTACAGGDEAPVREALVRAANDALTAFGQRLQELRKGGVRSAMPMT